MKKIVLVLFLVFFKSAAQPSLTASDFGAQVNYSVCYVESSSIYNLNYALEGTNKVWDFSNVTLTIPSSFTFSQSVSLCPGAENYPSSQYCEETISPGYASSYNLFEITDTAYKQTASSYNGVLYSTNNLTIFNLPYTYGQYEVLATNNLGYLTTKSYNGFGTLITPFETFNDVIKITTYYPGDMSGPGSTRYAFYTTNPYREIAYLNVPQNYTPNMVIYRYNALGLGTNSVDPFSTYPNPVKEDFYIKNTGVQEYDFFVTIYDIVGNEIAPRKKIDTKLAKIDLSKFATGIYLIKITNKENQLLHSGKIIKN